MIVNNLGNGGAGAFRRFPSSGAALKRSMELSAVFGYAAYRRTFLRRLGDGLGGETKCTAAYRE